MSALPWGVHTLASIFGRRDQTEMGVPDGRIVTAVSEPYDGNRLVAAWWVLTGRAFALRWPAPGELEATLYPKGSRQP